MKIIHAALPEETVQLHVEQSPVWELIVGIAGYTHGDLRHTFELDGDWQTDRDALPASLLELLDTIQQTNLWYGMILLQDQFAARTVTEFATQLTGTSEASFYQWLLPYRDRSAEPLRKRLALDPKNESLWLAYAELFEGHAYLSGYIRQLQQLSKIEISELFNSVLTEWQHYMSHKPQWDKWLRALAFEQQQHRQLDASNPPADIERVTGVHYLPEPAVWTVKLIPQVSYRPWVLTVRTSETKLLFYPINEEHLLEPGVPSNELIHGHKALGDELRLKLLFQLHKGPLSLQELSAQFKLSKTRLHHQLALLKAAKFVRVDKGVYSIHPEKIEAFSAQLARYLDSAR